MRATQSIGDVMPDVQLPLVAGGGVLLSERLRERRGAVVVFWSAGCAHCVRYDGYLNSFEQRHPDVALVTVAARRTETIDQIRLTVAERRYASSKAWTASRGIRRPRSRADG